MPILRRLLLLLLACAATSPRARSAPVLILGAVPQEVLPIRQALGHPAAERVDGIPCERGTLGAHEVVVAVTGIGKTNCAMVTSALLQHYRPAAVIWTGTGCRVRKSLRVGDIIVADKVMHYDVGVLTSQGMNYGDAERGGSPGGKAVFDSHFLGPDGRSSTATIFACDPALLAFARSFLRGYQPEPVVLEGRRYLPAVREGFIVTGDLFGLTETLISDIRRTLDPDLLEMEGAAFAQVCTFFGRPFLVIRGGSDLLKEDNPGDYALYSPIAARQAARFTQALVTALP